MKQGIAFFLCSLMLASTSFALPSNLSTVKTVVKKQSLPEPVNCQNLVDKLKEAKQLSSSLGNNVTATSEDISRVIGNWYGTLSTYEGRSVSFPYGYFGVMNQSANTSSQNAQVFRGDFAAVETQLTDILVVMQGCLR